MDVVTALAAIREKGLTEEADILEAAIDEALCDQPIVRIAGGMTADQIAEKVVAKLLEHTQVVGAKLVQKPIPDGLPPLPWSFSSYAVRDAYERAILWDMDIEADVNKPLTCEAIIAAMNAYYSPQTPAESAAANSETGIPDTAGYPLTDGTAQ